MGRGALPVAISLTSTALTAAPAAIHDVNMYLRVKHEYDVSSLVIFGLVPKIHSINFSNQTVTQCIADKDIRILNALFVLA